MACTGAEFSCYLRRVAKLLQAVANCFRNLPKAFGMDIIWRRHDENSKNHQILLS